jgi:CubicO group peptidase (beta-lactamase class C family)
MSAACTATSPRPPWASFSPTPPASSGTGLTAPIDRAPFLSEAALRAELAAAPTIEAGSRLKYSNHGFGVVGLAVEAITGEAYGAWIEREIVAPAGLEETSFDMPLPAGAKLARGHGSKVLLGRRLVFPGDQPTHALAPATGFVATAADLARFFSQLAPGAERSVLSAASRREMTRPQWKDPWSPLAQSYGLGVMSGTFEGWDWFGHGGGFLGYITRTAVVPEHDLAIAVLTNAVDGMAGPWTDGAMAILKRFKEEGPPNAALADWTGRWWSAWAPTDLVAMGEKVVLAAPGLANPVLKAAELTVTGPDEARVSQASAFASFGEPARLVRGEDGGVSEVRLAGNRLVSEAALAAELTGRYGG